MCSGFQAILRISGGAEIPSSGYQEGVGHQKCYRNLKMGTKTSRALQNQQKKKKKKKGQGIGGRSYRQAMVLLTLCGALAVARCQHVSV
jgi:hypothetical protein